MKPLQARALAASVVALVAVACSVVERRLPPCIEAPPEGGPTIETGGDPVVLAAGDIAEPSDMGAPESTAKLLDQRNGLVLAIGDTAPNNGSLDDFLLRYEPTWGRHRWRTRPAVGNHEYLTPNAAPYFAYFCAAAGEPFKGYYSFDLGAWHLIALNSGCAEPAADAPDCFAGSEQEAWLRADLAAHPSRCTLAYWHHPRFSSATGDNAWMTDVWRALREFDVDLVVNGHAHVYERFALQTADGAHDPAGIRQIVAGTGGQWLEEFGSPRPNSEVRIAGKHGILVLTLHATSYDWELVTVDGTPGDKGSDPCR
jgi:acid phosphatase type 7